MHVWGLEGDAPALAKLLCLSHQDFELLQYAALGLLQVGSWTQMAPLGKAGRPGLPRLESRPACTSKSLRHKRALRLDKHQLRRQAGPLCGSPPKAVSAAIIDLYS